MTRSLLRLYPRVNQGYDELLTSEGAVRPHWRKFFDALDGATPDEMRQRLEYIERNIQENGVTYNVHASNKGNDRPWAMDPLPLIIPADEWQQIASAVAQRATLLDAMLGDLYGERRLLSEGLLPPALVYGQRGYLFPCIGVRPPGNRWLHLYAVDLARAPDGRWWVIGDRTQAPAGAGYALENRLIVSAIFPELFRDLHVQHLASFFRDLQEGLASLARPEPGEALQIVLLTPGPYNATYFEHAYMARYLGYPLVEGQDLTVRGDGVFLKTLRGLKRVHVILRRQDDDFCDPLELRGDSALGVPGLLNAVRAGKVAMANALGSGILGSSAIMGFLPGICERLLGEPLAMPSVATWWCGERPAFDYVKEHFDKLVIKPAFPGQNFELVFGSECDAAKRRDLLARIAARPQAYLGQELVQLGKAPVWSRADGRRLLARSVGLRVYAVATPDGYSVMPGGLARVASDAQTQVISMQRGGSSKDTWVLTAGAVNRFSLLKRALGVEDLVHSGANLSSRVVENLFWFGRYSERADATARLLRVALTRLIDAGGEPTPSVVSAMMLAECLQVLPKEGEEGEDAEDTDYPSRHRLLDAIFSSRQACSLASAIGGQMWAAAQVRERLAVDHWHALNRLHRDLQAAQKREISFGNARTFLDGVLLTSASLNGFAMDNMTRDDGWRFLIAGRRLERLDFLGSAIAGFLRLDAARCEGSMEWLLEFADSIITFRSRYSRQPELLPVLNLIVFDSSNPHSVLFQIDALLRYHERIARDLGDGFGDGFAELVREYQTFDLGGFAGIDFTTMTQCPACDALAELLERTVNEARSVSDRLAQRYFTHTWDIGRQVFAA